MMLLRSVFVLLCLSALVPTLAFPKEGCRPAREKMRSSMKALRECNKTWRESVRTDAPEPADDCMDAQKAYVEAVRALRACRKDFKK